jgi:hypothetical protein
MRWEEVRKLYPNQFVKFEVTESHVKGNKEYVDDVAVIKAIGDGKAAVRELLNKKENQFIYSTKNEKVIINLVKQIGVRKGMRDG